MQNAGKWIIEYYEAASQDWYQFGDETFTHEFQARDRMKTLRVIDPYVSAKLSLRVRKKPA